MEVREERIQHHRQGENKGVDIQREGKGCDGQNSTEYKSKSTDKSNVECFRCHRYGHYCLECHTNLNKHRGERSNLVESNENEEEVSLLMVTDPKEETHKILWYLDTSCNNHMCGDRSTFSDLDETFCTTIKFGDNSLVFVKGKGKVKVQTKATSVQTISNVVFVPNLKTNLLSVGQLLEKGFEVIIKDGFCKIQDSKHGLVAKVSMTANWMFPLYFQNIGNSCFMAKLMNLAWLWHYRYRHLNFGGLKALQ
ncbi:uncharacterized protein LOC116109610 [Pistacia vera]|uniref:uncharacterized protein LOC116109610 n=1 Tax=Pistacia vera TaxID=55513 RepID=UPI001262CF8C|nr:uncharacterized protein LOC116109610 [Pistacia vera]